MENQNKYHNGKIYQITDIACNKCYIGSTCEELSQRMARHRALFKQFSKGGKVTHIRSYDLFNEYGVENCKIELIEYFKCDTLQELRRKEGEIIKNTECINKRVEGRTKQEWAEDNKDKIKEREREWYENNKENILEQRKKYEEQNKNEIKEYRKKYRELNKDKVLERERKYREQNRDKIKESREQNKDKIKEYREKHKDKMKEYHKEYKEHNKDKIKEYKK